MFDRIILPGIALALLAVPVAARGAGMWDSYFAPQSRAAFKLVLPGDERLFDRDDPTVPGRICSADGWTATFLDGSRVSVSSPETDGGKSTFEFDKGRLVAYISPGGERESVPYETPRAAPEGVLTPLAFFEYSAEYLKEKKEHVLDGKWEGSGRLAFPYENPNYSGALYCQLVLLFLAALFVLRGKARIAAALAAAAFFACLLMTGSRGSLLGLAVGLLPFAAFRFTTLLRSRRFWLVSFVAALAVFVWFGILHFDQLTRGFSSGGLDWSNSIRIDLLRAAPQMMVDAPGGWGFVGAGRAYFDWYQPVDSLYMTGSLMNDHLTVLANVGWLGRFAYLFGVVLLLLLSCLLAFRKGVFLPASLFVSVFVMSCFNPLSACLGLWALPALAAIFIVVWALRARDRRLVVVLGVSAVAASAVVASVFALCSLLPSVGGPCIAATGRQVLVNGSHPSIWIVDDEQGALGGIFVSKGIREFYARQPKAPSVGYVRSIGDLPGCGIRRLVLAGKAANEWLLLLSENPEARTNLPKEVVFVSPPFAPSEIPSAIFHFCKVRVVVGEFAARFQPEYATPRPFIEIVPGMERYVSQWLELVMEP